MIVPRTPARTSLAMSEARCNDEIEVLALEEELLYVRVQLPSLKFVPALLRSYLNAVL